MQFRNIFEAIDVQEVNNLLEALENGCKLTVIDIRANISSTKAHRFFMIRPGTETIKAKVIELLNPTDRHSPYSPPRPAIPYSIGFTAKILDNTFF